jgi:phage gp16-like protein
VTRLAMVHVARKQLDLDEDAYRAMLERVSGQRSAKDLTPGELDAVIAEMKRIGFEPSSKPRRGRLEGPYAGKLQALWIAGWNLGVVRDRSDAALTAFILRQTGIPTSRWLRYPEDARRVIEALKAWLAREAGVDWHPIRSVEAAFNDPRYRIVNAQFARLVALGGAEGEELASRTRQVTGKPSFTDYAADDWITLMNALGRAIRAAEDSAQGSGQ